MRLIDLQRDFMRWLASEDEGVAARLPLVDQRGLGVYINNYHGALMACLAESFPQTMLWLGEDAFNAAAARHIDRVPPSSWTLDDYARGFPESLAEDYPYDHEVGELARIELILSDLFIAADAPALSPAEMPGIDWDRAVLRLVPAFELFSLHSNAPEIWMALAEEETPPATIMEPAGRFVIAWRQDWMCRFRVIDDTEAHALGMLRGEGIGFATLCGAMIEGFGEVEGVSRAGTYLGQWVAAGLLRAL